MDFISFNPIQQASLQMLSSINERLSDQEEGASPIASFKEMLEMMMPLMTMQSLSSSMNTQSGSGQNDFGMNLNLMMAPLMLSLMEELMSMQVSGVVEEEKTEQGNALTIGALSDAQSIHINQFEAEKMVGGDGANANCGPTSLVMSLRALGIDLIGAQSGGNAGTAVDMARQMMVADGGRDGIGTNGNRSEAEHSTWTNFGDLARGASAFGVKNWQITPDAGNIKSILQDGGQVIISGTFTGKYPLPWTGDRGFDNGGAPGGATGHIVAVTGYDPDQGMFIVNDPARKSPLLVDSRTLEYFMSGNAGALAMTKSAA